MDLPHSATTSTIVNHSLEVYKQMYSEYLNHLVDLHNYHHVFLYRMGKPSVKDIRRSIQSMIKSEKKLYAACWAAYHESMEINKTLKLQQKEAGIQAKLFRQQKKKAKLNKPTIDKRKNDGIDNSNSKSNT